MPGPDDKIKDLLDFEKPLPALDEAEKAVVLEEGETSFTDLVDGLMRGTKLIEDHKRERSR